MGVGRDYTAPNHLMQAKFLDEYPLCILFYNPKIKKNCIYASSFLSCFVGFSFGFCFFYFLNPSCKLEMKIYLFIYKIHPNQLCWFILVAYILA